MATLTDTQIALIKKIGVEFVADTELTLSESETLETLKASRLVRIRARSGTSGTTYYELGKKGFAMYWDWTHPAPIEQPAIETPIAEEIETNGVLVGEPAMEIACDTCGKLFWSLDSYHTECDEAAADYDFDVRLNEALIGTERPRKEIECIPTRTVTIPACDEHEGVLVRVVTLKWVCPVCGGKRGEPRDAVSFDGSRRLYCHGWSNPCGHIDKYDDVRKEADAITPVEAENDYHEDIPGAAAVAMNDYWNQEELKPIGKFALGDKVTLRSWQGIVTEVDEYDPTHVQVTYLCEREEWCNEYELKPAPVDPKDAEIERLRTEIAQLRDERDGLALQIEHMDRASEDRAEAGKGIFF